MEYKLVSNAVSTAKEARYLVDEIKDNIFDELYMRVMLDENEVNDLIFEIIKEDTQIDIKELDLSVEYNNETRYVEIDDDWDLTDEEKKYIKNTLSRQYGANVLKDMINPVIKQKLNTEHYELTANSYNTDFAMTIEIQLSDFGKKNEICRYLNMIE